MLNISKLNLKKEQPSVEAVVEAVNKAFETDAVIGLKNGIIVGYKVTRHEGKWSMPPAVLLSLIGKTPDDLPSGYCYEFEEIGGENHDA